MSLSLSTHGMLWPQAAIFREQFTSIDVVLEMVDSLDTTVDLLDEIEVSCEYQDLEVTVEELDSIESEVSDGSIEVELNPCN